MRSHRWRWGAAVAAAMSAAASGGPASAGGPPAGPATVQLTVDSPAFVLTHRGAAGGLLLRELQRQAVLVAAREELGLRTRDGALGESGPVAGGVALRAEARVWRGDKAEVRLSTVGGSTDRPWLSFPVSPDPLVDYPAFVAGCEAASRDAYPAALRSLVGDGRVGRPTAWADGPAPADPAALALLERFDVFSQFRAAQRLHRQVRDAGASPERLSGLVRAYANLGQLTTAEWSPEPRAYVARSLLYAERLWVHEHGSAASLYARAYARGMTDVAAAALADLDAADGATARAGGRPPAWAGALRAYCHRDLPAAAALAAAGPRRGRPLGRLLAAFASYDDYPTPDVVRATDDTLSVDPGPLVLMTAVANNDDAHLSHLVDPLTDVLAVLAREQLRGDAALPPGPATAALAALVPPAGDGPATLAGLAAFRDGLARAAGESDAAQPAAEPSAEPSLAALASLVEQQAFVGVVRRAVGLRSNSGAAEVAKYTATVGGIAHAHPWGPYLDLLAVDDSADPAQARRLIDAVPAAAVGPWAERAASDLSLSDDRAKTVADRWTRPAHLTSDPLVGDYSAESSTTLARRACRGDVAGFLRRVRLTDPHSAVLMDAWMTAVGPDRGAADPAAYAAAVGQVEAEFAGRPALAALAADWCQAAGAFDRGLGLLRAADAVDPSADLCDRLSRTAARAGHAEAAVDYAVRGARLAVSAGGDDAADGAMTLFQLAAVERTAAGRWDEAMSFLHRGANAPDARGLLLMARCEELRGRPDAAEDCYRQATTLAPATIVPYALWARRTGRRSAADVHAKAVAAMARPAVNGLPQPPQLQQQPPPQASPMPAFYLAMADGQAAWAADGLRAAADTLSDPLDLAQLAAADAATGDPAGARAAVDRAAAAADVTDTAAADTAADADGPAVAVPPATGPPAFGRVFAALARSPDPDAARAAFDAWCDRQLDPDASADWHSAAGRYLLAAGHPAAGRAELALVLASDARDHESYFLAWLAAGRPAAAAKTATGP